MRLIEEKIIVVGCVGWNKRLLLLLLLGFQFMTSQAQDQGSVQLSQQDQEVSQYQHWLELMAADQGFADRSVEIGRTGAFLEFLGQGSTVFRDGPVDALELYSSETFQNNVNEISWEAHYVDVSRAGDLGLTAGPLNFLGNASTGQFGHLISIWQRQEGRWVLMADIVASIPGFLSLEVEPNFDDTRPCREDKPESNTTPQHAVAYRSRQLIWAINKFSRWATRATALWIGKYTCLSARYGSCCRSRFCKLSLWCVLRQSIINYEPD